jgi:hypothetical protein
VLYKCLIRKEFGYDQNTKQRNKKEYYSLFGHFFIRLSSVIHIDIRYEDKGITD